jgi:hypothetical protein
MASLILKKRIRVRNRIINFSFVNDAHARFILHKLANSVTEQQDEFLQMLQISDSEDRLKLDDLDIPFKAYLER